MRYEHQGRHAGGDSQGLVRIAIEFATQSSFRLHYDGRFHVDVEGATRARGADRARGRPGGAASRGVQGDASVDPAANVDVDVGADLELDGRGSGVKHESDLRCGSREAANVITLRFSFQKHSAANPTDVVKIGEVTELRHAGKDSAGGSCESVHGDGA